MPTLCTTVNGCECWLCECQFVNANLSLGNMAQATVTIGPLASALNKASLAAYIIHDDVGEVLFTREQMATKVLELGTVLGSDYMVRIVYCLS